MSKWKVHGERNTDSSNWLTLIMCGKDGEAGIVGMKWGGWTTESSLTSSSIDKLAEKSCKKKNKKGLLVAPKVLVLNAP